MTKTLKKKKKPVKMNSVGHGAIIRMPKRSSALFKRTNSFSTLI